MPISGQAFNTGRIGRDRRAFKQRVPYNGNPINGRMLFRNVHIPRIVSSIRSVDGIVKITGKVIDGPLSNAKVFLDYSDNSIHDQLPNGALEPFALTDGEGNYELVLDPNLGDKNVNGDPVKIVVVSTDDTVNTTTGNKIKDFALTASVPSDLTKRVMVNPLTTIGILTTEDFQNAFSQLPGKRGEMFKLLFNIDPSTFDPYNPSTWPVVNPETNFPLSEKEQRDLAVEVEVLNHQIMLLLTLAMKVSSSINGEVGTGREAGSQQSREFLFNEGAQLLKDIIFNNKDNISVDPEDDNIISDLLLSIAQTVDDRAEDDVDGDGKLNTRESAARRLRENILTNKKKNWGEESELEKRVSRIVAIQKQISSSSGDLQRAASISVAERFSSEIIEGDVPDLSSKIDKEAGILKGNITIGSTITANEVEDLFEALKNNYIRFEELFSAGTYAGNPGKSFSIESTIDEIRSQKGLAMTRDSLYLLNRTDTENFVSRFQTDLTNILSNYNVSALKEAEAVVTDAEAAQKVREEQLALAQAAAEEAAVEAQRLQRELDSLSFDFALDQPAYVADLERRLSEATQLANQRAAAVNLPNRLKVGSEEETIRAKKRLTEVRDENDTVIEILQELYKCMKSSLFIDLSISSSVRELLSFVTRNSSSSTGSDDIIGDTLMLPTRADGLRRARRFTVKEKKLIERATFVDLINDSLNIMDSRFSTLFDKISEMSESMIHEEINDEIDTKDVELTNQQVVKNVILKYERFSIIDTAFSGREEIKNYERSARHIINFNPGSDLPLLIDQKVKGLTLSDRYKEFYKRSEIVINAIDDINQIKSDPGRGDAIQSKIRNPNGGLLEYFITGPGSNGNVLLENELLRGKINTPDKSFTFGETTHTEVLTEAINLIKEIDTFLEDVEKGGFQLESIVVDPNPPPLPPAGTPLVPVPVETEPGSEIVDPELITSIRNDRDAFMEKLEKLKDVFYQGTGREDTSYNTLNIRDFLTGYLLLDDGREVSLAFKALNGYLPDRFYGEAIARARTEGRTQKRLGIVEDVPEYVDTLISDINALGNINLSPTEDQLLQRDWIDSGGNSGEEIWEIFEKARLEVEETQTERRQAAAAAAGADIAAAIQSPSSATVTELRTQVSKKIQSIGGGLQTGKAVSVVNRIFNYISDSLIEEEQLPTISILRLGILLDDIVSKMDYIIDMLNIIGNFTPTSFFVEMAEDNKRKIDSFQTGIKTTLFNNELWWQIREKTKRNAAEKLAAEKAADEAADEAAAEKLAAEKAAAKSTAEKLAAEKAAAKSTAEAVALIDQIDVTDISIGDRVNIFDYIEKQKGMGGGGWELPLLDNEKLLEEIPNYSFTVGVTTHIEVLTEAIKLIREIDTFLEDIDGILSNIDFLGFANPEQTKSDLEGLKTKWTNIRDDFINETILQNVMVVFYRGTNRAVPDAFEDGFTVLNVKEIFDSVTGLTNLTQPNEVLTIVNLLIKDINFYGNAIPPETEETQIQTAWVEAAVENVGTNIWELHDTARQTLIADFVDTLAQNIERQFKTENLLTGTNPNDPRLVVLNRIKVHAERIYGESQVPRMLFLRVRLLLEEIVAKMNYIINMYEIMETYIVGNSSLTSYKQQAMDNSDKVLEFLYPINLAGEMLVP